MDIKDKDPLKFNDNEIWDKGNFDPDNKSNVGHNHIISNIDNLQFELDIRNLPFVAGTQVVSTSAWIGVADTIDTLVNGITIRYWLPRTSTSTAVTLNLTLKGGDTTGAIACYYGGTSRLTTHYSAGNIVTLTYIVNQSINGTLYTGWWAGANYADGNTYDRTYWNNTITAGVAIYDYKLLMQGLDGKFYPLTLEAGTGTTKTISTQEFEVNTTILYYASTTDISAGATLTNVYSEIPMTTLNYTANQASWTSQLPIYLKGTILPNGNFKLDNTSYTSFITQTLPTIPDGFVYVLLGYMYSTTGMRLFQYHPMYEFRDGYLRVYAVVHTHGNITDDGKIGSTANLAIMTTTDGKVTTGTLPIGTGGTGATTASGVLTNLGLTTTVTELNYIDGVTSNVQTQLSTKAPIASPTFTGIPKSTTPATADNSIQIATTAFVKEQGYITSAQAGTIITTSSTQPVSPKAGDIWIHTY